MSRDRLDAALHAATGALRQLADAGDHVSTVMPRTVEAFAWSWACMLAGVTEVPVPADSSHDEAMTLLSDARPTALVASTDAPGVRTAAEALGLRVVDRPAGRPSVPDADAPRTRPMSYTSGTTGRRKGVHAGLHDPAWGRAWLDDERAAFGDRHGPRHLVVSPLYHSGPLRHALVTADAGGEVSVLPRFDVGTWLSALREVRPTSLFCVPTHLHRLLAHPDFRPDDLASLTLLLHAGAPCPQELKERVHEAAPDDSVWEFYGSTEGQFTVCPPGVWAASPGTVGVARPDRTVTVRDDRGAPVPAGTAGRVWATAPAHARWSYWEQPEATAAAWDGDRFTVDDVGHLDDSGRLHLHGRVDDLVITGGVNVYPAEVEQVLRGAPGVADAAVFGLPDEEWGQRVVAVVVPSDGPRPDPHDVLTHARAHLSPARVPRQVVVVDDLPRTPTGKVRRRDLAPLVGHP